MASTKHTVGSFIFDYLYQKGVKHAFGIPGDFALPTFRWLSKSKMDLITMTHEPSVGFAADAYARVNGLSVAVVTYCVGGLNMLNSIACAYAEKSPVIVISGGPSPNERKKDPLVHHKVKTFDTQRKIYEEVTCANTVLTDPETAAAEIMRVVETVLAECRPGYIEIPYDVVDLPIKVPAHKPEPKPVSDAESLRACIEEAVSFINRAKQPVILADVELHRHKLTDVAVQIAEKFNIPIAATLLSKSAVGEMHPLYIGAFAGPLSEPGCQKYVNESDCVIMLGTFITDVLFGFNKPTLERAKSIMVTTETARVGYHHYEDVVFEDFLHALKDAPIKARTGFTNPNPPQKVEPLTHNERGRALDPENFFRIVMTHIGDNSTFVCDTGDALLGAAGLRTTRHQNFVADAYYLSMGFAIPAAIGVMAADPKTRTFVLVGDGAFQMTGMELSTAARRGMQPIVLLMNNDGYGTQRHIIDGPFNDILQWNYAKVVDVLGRGKSRRVETFGELDDALSEAVKSNELFVIEAMLPKYECTNALKRVGEGLKALRDKEAGQVEESRREAKTPV